MACYLTYDKDGKLLTARCTFREKPKVCHYCRRASTKRCDWKLTTGRTCNLQVCESCTTHQEPDIDHCKAHTDIPTFRTASGRWYDAKYKSVCAHPNCRRRVEMGEKILWLGPIYGVIGEFVRPRPTIRMRLGVYGYFAPVAASSVLECEEIWEEA